MKHLLNIFLFLVFTTVCHSQDKGSYYIGYNYNILADSTVAPTQIIDTVDAVVLIADWENRTTTWQFVKAIRTGHKSYMNDYTPIEDLGNGISVSYLVYHTIETTVWDNIEFWAQIGTLELESDRSNPTPVWGFLDKKRILMYHFKPDE